MLVCAALDHPGVGQCRGYIQSWGAPSTRFTTNQPSGSSRPSIRFSRHRRR
jgi:hypothetical protein